MYNTLFTPQRYSYNSNKEINLVQKGKGSVEVTISRSLCHYKLFSLLDIPLARRQAVIQLKIKQWSPFNIYGTYVCWHQHMAMVWVWDKVPLEKALSITDLKIKHINFYPETVLYSSNDKDGVRCIQCINGIEAQIWKNKVLVSSRWWISLPNPLIWHKFLRAQGIKESQDKENIISLSFNKKAWGSSKKALILTLLRQEMIWGTLIVSILLSIISWKLIYIQKWQQAIDDIEQKIEILTPKAQPILIARNKVLTANETIQGLQSLNPYPSQLEVMAEITVKLVEKNIQLVNWSYSTDKLKFSFQAKDLDPRFYVKKLQEVTFLKNVEISINKKQIDVSAQLKQK